MTLAFPNPSRSFDASRNAVRFTGYDGVFEVSFLVEAGTLLGTANASGDQTSSESDALSAFDGKVTAIHGAAHRAYAGGRGPSYTLVPSDFR
jgi:hypothetical protein